MSPGGYIHVSTEGRVGGVVDTNNVIIQAMNGDTGFSTSNRRLDDKVKNKRLIELAEPIKDENDNVEYIVYTRVDQEEIMDSLLRMSKSISI